MAKLRLLSFLLIFGLAAGQLFEVDQALQNIFHPQANKPGAVTGREHDIVINDPSKFPDPNAEANNRPNIVIPDPETERPIGSHNKPSNGGFQILEPEVPATHAPNVPNSGNGFQIFPEVTTENNQDGGGEIPVFDWDFSRKTTKKPVENKQPGIGGIWGSIIGGAKDVFENKKDFVENAVDSTIDVGEKFLNTSQSATDHVIDAKKEVLETINVDGTFLNATKEVVDNIYDKKHEALNNLRPKDKGISQPFEDENGKKGDSTYVWNEPNDVAGDIFDEVNWEMDNNVTSKY